MKVPEDLLAQAYSDWVYLNDDGTPRDTDDPRLDKEERSMQETALGILGVVTNWFAAHELIDLNEWCPLRIGEYCGRLHTSMAGTMYPLCPCVGGMPCRVLAARKETT